MISEEVVLSEKRVRKNELQRIRSRRYYEKHTEEMKARAREWNKTHKDKRKITLARYYLKNRDKENTRSVKWAKAHIDHVNAMNRKRREEIRLEVLAHYSGNPPKCTMCGISDNRVLTIDHINGHGNEHRKAIKRKDIGRWLKSNGYPDGYQILCMNCQLIKRREQKEGFKGN